MARTLKPHPHPKHVQVPAATHPAVISESLKWHLFFLQAVRLQAKPYWPLAGYYAYLDTGVYDSLSFDELGLLFTDENGSLHYTSSDGRPTEPVTHFAFAWSTIYQDSDIETCTLIYDDSLDRLKKRKQQVEQAGKGSALAGKYKVKRKQLTRFALTESGYPKGAMITVPRDDEVLPLDRLEAFIYEQEKNLKAAHVCQEAIQSLVARNVENQVMYLHRQQINGWLNEPGKGRRRHLLRPNAQQRDSETRWDIECRLFDQQLQKLVVAYEDSLDPLYDAFVDDLKMDLLGKVGLIVEDWNDPAGDFLLWRHQFLTEAAGMFCGSRRHKEIFEHVVQPVARSLSYPFTLLRVQCKCATCSAMVEGKTAVAEESLEKLTEHKGWRSKDLRIGTRTIQRSLDLFTKFAPNFAWMVVYTGVWTSKGLSHTGIMSWWFFVRAGVIGPGGSSPELADQWLGMVNELAQNAKKGEGQLDDFTKKITDFLKTKIRPKTALNMEIVTDLLGFVGAGILTYSVLSKEGKLSVKDAIDLSRALADATRAGLGLSRRSLEKTFIAEFGEVAGPKLARGLPRYVQFAQAAKYIGVAGGALQVASSWISLRDAADKGDKREFAWTAVQYAGADIAFSGLVLDACPEPVVTKGSGIALNVIGGIVYLVGQGGEFFTRPGTEQDFLEKHMYYDSDEHGPE